MESSLKVSPRILTSESGSTLYFRQFLKTSPSSYQN